MARSDLFRYFVLALLLHACNGEDSLALGASLTGNKTIISRNGTFELGFFSPNGTNNWYLGIWYAQSSRNTIVWVANRETPLRNIPGLLELSKEGYLGLFNADGASVWSAKGTKKASLAMVLDSGNFVLLGAENISEPVWQSFDHPVDTWLPGMNFTEHQKLVSWRNYLDPAPGLFAFQMYGSDYNSIGLGLQWNDSVMYWRSIYNGSVHLFSDQVPEMASKYIYKFSMEDSNSITYTVMSPSPNVLSRFVVDMQGKIKLYSLMDEKGYMLWSEPTNLCDVYGLCGAYGICTPNDTQVCSCLQGFRPRDDHAWAFRDWSGGCVRHTPLQCSAENKTSDRFLEVRGLSLESGSGSGSYGRSQQECAAECLRDCSCTAFSIDSSNCTFWNKDLRITVDPSSLNNRSIFIRLASSSGRSIVWILCISLGAGGAATVAISFALFTWRRRLRLRKKGREEDEVTTFLRTFKYKELRIATSNFRDKLGRGAFGSVFKGTLPNGTLVAVKRFEGAVHSEKQFRAEISTVGNIQHVNLVRLRGFCAERSEMLLVYDYMPNGSLNNFLFSSNSKREREVLDWSTRFKIALGIARGLVYLHEGCQDRIIHCDIKPENILLDADFSPKLADFGLAKLVGRNFSRVLTTTRGTRGYLAPEWLSGLPITPKADVYSFGMTLLEIISGRRNLEFVVQESRYYFPTWASSQIHNGNVLGVVDEMVADNINVEEATRVALVSMLCIQDEENVRPSMAQVLLMLEGKTEVHKPQIPATLFILMGHSHEQGNEIHSTNTTNTSTSTSITNTSTSTRASIS